MNPANMLKYGLRNLMVDKALKILEEYAYKLSEDDDLMLVPDDIERIEAIIGHLRWVSGLRVKKGKVIHVDFK